MTRNWSRTILPLTLVVLCLAGPSVALDDPHIGYVYPAGVRQGTACEVTVGGQHLGGAREAYVSGSGVKARVLEHRKALTRQQINTLRQRLREMVRLARGDAPNEDATPLPKGPIGGYDLESMSRRQIQALIDKYRDPKKQRNDQISETVRVKLALDADAEPGVRELRLLTDQGLSNPIYFHVGTWPEVSEQERGDDHRAMSIGNELPVTINGQILPGDVDRFRFHALRGQRLVVAVSARELIPYLADAVPGWFQATLGLFDARGNELAYADDFRFQPDPVLYYEIPEGGDYVLEIKDSIYRGREDFVYRITLGELPFVTSLFPLGGPAGELTATAVDGWNLPVDRFVMDWSGAEPGVQQVAVVSGPHPGNRVPFMVDNLPECLESEPNDEASDAQQISVPMIVNGRIGEPGDRDVFALRGRAGDELVAEVFARRLYSPLDSVLTLFDSSGRQLAANDDHLDPGAGLTTHHADSRLSFTLPDRGAYYLHLQDAQAQGGLAHAYRLRIHPREPDFELRVVPSSLNVRSGGTVSLTVHALRRDGFEGAIELSLKDGPAGFSLGGARIPADADEVRLTLKAPRIEMDEPIPLGIEGRAVVGRRELCRRAQPADDRTQAFITHHLVPAEELFVSVVGRGKSRLSAQLLDSSPVELPAGGTAEVLLTSVLKRPRGASIELTLNDPPEGIAIEGLNLRGGRTVIVLFADEERAEVGQRGNLIIDVYAVRTTKSRDGQDRRRRFLLGTLPAIPFEIVPGS